MRPLVVIRPQPGNAATCAAARAAGLDPRGYPLFEVIAQGWAAPDPAGFDALLIGSANALRHAGPGLAALASLPALVVGEVTAAAARAAGLRVELTGSGGLQGVVDNLPAGCTRLLRLAGAERTALALPPGVTMAERVVYASMALPLPGELAELLRSGAVVALHSAAAARHFAGQCRQRAGIALAALAPRIAAAAGDGWDAVAVAATPDDHALLALAARMCQD